MLLQDLRYGFRTLRRSPGFTGAALLTLALGIGANTAIFSVVNAVLLRPLPYRDPGALVQLVRWYHTGPAPSQDGRRYLFFRDNLRSLEALAAYRGGGSVNMVRGDRAEFVSVAQVSKEYFGVFGVSPVLGQAFTAEHDVAGGPAVAILSHGPWQPSFGARADVVGSSIVIADTPLTVIGVTALIAIVTGLLFGLAPALSLVRQDLVEAFKDDGARSTGSRRAGWLRRLLVTAEVALCMLLLIGAGCVYGLIACSVAQRTREFGIRMALGATRGHILGSVLRQGLALALFGVIAGAIAAVFATRILQNFVWGVSTLDVPTFTAVAVLLLVVSGTAGLVPAVRAVRLDQAAALRE